MLMAIAAMPGRVGAQEACNAQVLARLTAPAGKGSASYPLTCSVTLQKGQSIPRGILLKGQNASGVVIDCQGGMIGVEGHAAKPSGQILIQSAQVATVDDVHWSRPTDITIRNCRIMGSIRTRGVDPGSNHEREARLSRRPDWTAVAQRSAPTRIKVLDSEIDAGGAIPLYLGTGTTGFTLSNTKIRGTAALAIYLDQESAQNRIENNDIDIIVKGRRELIAVDGSAHNIIRGNRMAIRSPGGAIRLYRNCGERGVIRHQTPSFNQVSHNFLIDMVQLNGPGIVENSRSHRKAPYCDLDKGYPFGSSSDDRDGGHDNDIRENRMVKKHTPDPG